MRIFRVKFEEQWSYDKTGWQKESYDVAAMDVEAAIEKVKKDRKGATFFDEEEEKTEKLLRVRITGVEFIAESDI